MRDKRVKYIIAIVLTLVISLAALTCAPAPESKGYHFRLSCAQPEDHPITQAALRMVD